MAQTRVFLLRGTCSPIFRHDTSRYFGYPISSMTGGSCGYLRALSDNISVILQMLSLLFVSRLPPFISIARCLLSYWYAFDRFWLRLLFGSVGLITYFVVSFFFFLSKMGYTVYIDSFKCTNTRFREIYILCNQSASRYHLPIVIKYQRPSPGHLLEFGLAERGRVPM